MHSLPPSNSPDNREYTVVQTILFKSPKGPTDEKCLGPADLLRTDNSHAIVGTWVSSPLQCQRLGWNRRGHCRGMLSAT
jgi:hypothetical protein